VRVYVQDPCSSAQNDRLHGLVDDIHWPRPDAVSLGTFSDASSTPWAHALSLTSVMCRMRVARIGSGSPWNESRDVLDCKRFHLRCAKLKK
jgi:hypothetical protein